MNNSSLVRSLVAIIMGAENKTARRGLHRLEATSQLWPAESGAPSSPRAMTDIWSKMLAVILQLKRIW